MTITEERNRILEIMSEGQESIVKVDNLTDIVKHIQTTEHFAVISAYQKGKTNEENSRATLQLEKLLNSFSPKVIPLTGEWDENIPEKSFFVLQPEKFTPESFLKIIKNISDKFGQESFLYSKEGDIIIVNKDNSIDDIGDDLNITNSYVGFKFK